MLLTGPYDVPTNGRGIIPGNLLLAEPTGLLIKSGANLSYITAKT